jgi:hypothetical protein
MSTIGRKMMHKIEDNARKRVNQGIAVASTGLTVAGD